MRRELSATGCCLVRHGHGEEAVHASSPRACAAIGAATGASRNTSSSIATPHNEQTSDSGMLPSEQRLSVDLSCTTTIYKMLPMPRGSNRRLLDRDGDDSVPSYHRSGGVVDRVVDADASDLRLPWKTQERAKRSISTTSPRRRGRCSNPLTSALLYRSIKLHRSSSWPTRHDQLVSIRSSEQPLHVLLPVSEGSPSALTNGS